MRVKVTRVEIIEFPHDCDEDCTQCTLCYVATGTSGCDQLCEHGLDDLREEIEGDILDSQDNEHETGGEMEAIYIPREIVTVKVERE